MDLKCEIKYLSKEEALKSNAMHLFNEKYADVVRVVNFEDVSSEFCGGCHVTSTKEIGLFSITSEESVASGILRIEARTSLAAYEQMKQKEKLLNNITALLKCGNPIEISQKIKSLMDELSLTKKTVDNLSDKLSTYRAKELTSSFEEKDGKHVLVAKLSNLDRKNFIATFDTLKVLHKDYIILLANVADGKISYIAGVSDSLTNKYQAGMIIREICSLTDGSGGGRKDTAQGGAKNIAKLDDALNIIKGKL